MRREENACDLTDEEVETLIEIGRLGDGARPSAELLRRVIRLGDALERIGNNNPYVTAEDQRELVRLVDGLKRFARPRLVAEGDEMMPVTVDD